MYGVRRDTLELPLYRRTRPEAPGLVVQRQHEQSVINKQSPQRTVCLSANPQTSEGARRL